MQAYMQQLYRDAFAKLALYRNLATMRGARAKDVLGNAIWQASSKTGAKRAAAKGRTGSSDKKGGSPEGGNGGGGGGSSPSWNDVVQAALMLALLLAFSSFSSGSSPGAGLETIDFQTFRNNILARDMVDKVEIAGKTVRVFVFPETAGAGTQQGATEQSAAKYTFQVGSVDTFERQLESAQASLGWAPQDFVPVVYRDPDISLTDEFLKFLPTLLVIGALIWTSRSTMRSIGANMGGGGRGRNIFNVGKAQVTFIDKNDIKTTFRDVAGCDEAKIEIMEFVKFLQTPERFARLGAHIPKGALLTGPPGTGKTLLAKATAGEAGVPFLSISGSDFVEMFVGVGPARVRDLFAQARANAPSIIFIDEIDAVARARGQSGFMGGNDERENTLNQLLVEMDGFSTTSNVVILAGTNRPDVLDKALLRPGRFDRQITVDVPDVKGREAIFKIHLEKIKLDKPLDFYAPRLAALTPGMSGADIANVVNEAALVAARRSADAVALDDFEAAADRIIAGLEKRNKVVSPEERRTVAYHEAGHAVVGWFTEHCDPLLKVSIVPRGSAALGFAQYLPNENLLYTLEQLEGRISMSLGGRAAEEIFIGKVSTGAQNDLEKITQMAYSTVAVYGMNDRVGLVSFPPDKQRLDKPYSDDTARLIDQEVRAVVSSCYDATLNLLREKREAVEALAQELLKKEVIGLDDLDRILGKRPFATRELQNIDKFRGELQQGMRAWLPGGDVWEWIASFRGPGVSFALDGAGGALQDGDDSGDGGTGGGGHRLAESQEEEEFGWWADETAPDASSRRAKKQKYPVAT
eukprot:jgi/Ulvmu1/1126/UM106_0043.1